ncbi:hypothetical protein EJB05_11471 [Eragrostis curvula]|uniref:DUF6598 domain-containing protein n=1 Tax=Eragrostis curvula TaxID=38414 RepID=A0A5J9VRE6_9POAL|nr:hypothetical protein EJB05_11471 [Eragrostis curvula]
MAILGPPSPGLAFLPPRVLWLIWRLSKMHAMLLSLFALFKFRFDAPFIHSFIKSWIVASIPGLFICMWCVAKKHCLANNVLGIPSRFQLLFPTADAAVPSSMLSIGDTVMSGICVALALCIAVPRGSKNPFFNCAFLRCTVSLTVIISIMNWFQAAQGVGLPALRYVASGMIGFVAVNCLWNGEVKQGDTNQLMGEAWDWNMYGTKLKKFHEWILHTAEDGDGGEDDATALPEDPGDGPNDGSSSGSDDHNGHEDREADSDYSIDGCGPRAVQLLAIRANYHISAIMAYDWHEYRLIYEGEVQEEGMVDLVPIGPCRILEAYGCLGFKVFTADDEVSCIDWWDVTEDEEVEEYTQTLCGGPGRKLEITYVVIPDAIETHVEVRLNLKDLGSRSHRAVYGSIKASAIDYGGKSVHLFSCERGRSLCLPCGSTSILPLTPYVIALQYRRRFEIHIEVDLRVITTFDSQEEDKNMKFCLDFTHRNTNQKRDVDGDQVEVNITWYTDKR